jgi:hypothetical protein
MIIEYPIEYTVNQMIKNHGTEKYMFFEGHPVDTHMHKYKIWYLWAKNDQLRCFGCNLKADHLQLVKTKGDGSLHESGLRKYTFKMFSADGLEFTIDHWYPKWYLKQSNLMNTHSNLVPMCKPCNTNKADAVPSANGVWHGRKYKPQLIKFANI